MKIHYRVTRPYLSHALRRIEDGIRLTLPDGYKLVQDQTKADLCICPVVNINDTKNIPEDAVIWQLCYETAGGEFMQWLNLWAEARAVFSYLDLPIDWYTRIPLGYDPTLFNAYGRQAISKYDVVVTGYMDEDEHGEVIGRLIRHFDNVIHIGKDLKLGKGYHHAKEISDTQLAQIYRQSKFVAGMRLIEGFELPIIEGAACGCIPITLNLECYHHWFDDFAEFVNPDDLDKGLSFIDRTTSPIKVLGLVQKYTWQNVMDGFWGKIQ